MLSQPLLRFVVLSLWFGFLLPWLGILSTSAPLLSQLGAGIVCAFMLVAWNWCLDPLSQLTAPVPSSNFRKRVYSFMRWSVQGLLVGSPALLMWFAPLIMPFTVTASLVGIVVGTLFVTGSLLLVDTLTS